MTRKIVNKRQYTDEQRKEACIQYAILGTMKATVKAVGIPETTIRDWRDGGYAEWDALTEKIRTQNDDQYLAKAHKIIEASQAVVMSKLPDASAAQASIIGATWIDKSRVIQAKPTSIVGRSDDTGALMQRFRDLSKQYHEKQARVVSVQEKSGGGGNKEGGD